MAYAVQVEEDRVNQRILELHREAVKETIRRDNITTALEYGDIRARDDLLTQKADAQAGRVLRDREGNLVRVQQYILRPDDNTVQVLNVSLRGGTGDLSGLSTIDWQTRFTESIVGRNLKTLPWNTWLDTRTDGTNRFVLTTLGAPQLQDMSVAFTNPASESLKESRAFDARTLLNNEYRQDISNEQLTLATGGGTETYTYASGPLVNGQYNVVPDHPGTGNNPGGFHYALRAGGLESTINVALFVVGDADTAENTGISSQDYSDQNFKDIWDTLRVNESGAPNIGSNNLEIAIDGDKQFFNQPIDVIYIPMSRMLWK